MRTSGPMTAFGPMTVPAPISAPRPITAPGSTITPEFEPRRRVNGRRRGNSRLAKNGARLDRRRVKFGHHQGHRAVRLGGDEHGASRWRGAGVARRNERRGRPGPLERVEIPGIVEEGQIARARLIESGDVPDRRDWGQHRRQASRRTSSRLQPTKAPSSGEKSESWPIRSSVRSDGGRASLWRARLLGTAAGSILERRAAREVEELGLVVFAL